MPAVRRFVLLALFLAVTASPVTAQFGRSKKVTLKRALPPAVALEAKSFNITATSQEAAGQAVAASFQELFRAKIQGDSRFVYTDLNPALRISITVTRFYLEPKQLTRGKSSCSTYLGSLQGTFSVIESDSGRPIASDSIGWQLTTNEEQHILVSDDGRGVGIEGPQHKFTEEDMRDNVEQSSFASKLGLGNPFSRNHPCDVPFSQNEAQDALADIFLADMIHLATPYSLTQEIEVSNDREFRDAVEEMNEGRWSTALDELVALGEREDNDDEAARLHLMALADEALGYRQGEESFAVNERIRTGLSEEQLALEQAELKRVEDLAKEYFDEAAFLFSEAEDLDDKDQYRAGQRRADQSRSLYARIQKYRSLQEQPAPGPQKSTVSMAEIISMCQQGSSALIIVDRIENADEISATREQTGMLSACGDKQDAIFTVLKARWDAQ